MFQIIFTNSIDLFSNFLIYKSKLPLKLASMKISIFL